MNSPFEVRAIDGFPGIHAIVLEPNKGPMVVLDHDLIARLDATIAVLRRDSRGVVLTSGSERVFVAGADLASIQSLGAPELHKYLEYGAKVFGRLSQLPYPTAAAIGGAALGGGLELAMHCDGLIGGPSASGKPFPVGLPEAGLSICPGWGGTNLLPARIDPADAISRTAKGEPMTSDQAVAAGLFDAVAGSAAELVSTAAAWVAKAAEGGRVERDGAPSRWIGRLSGTAKFKAASVAAALQTVRPELPKTAAAEAVAQCVEVGLAEGWPAALDAERRNLVHLRTTPEGKGAIEAFFAKSKK
jgi:3-hydroxyacyl-CoA dehydrogenase